MINITSVYSGQNFDWFLNNCFEINKFNMKRTFEHINVNIYNSFEIPRHYFLISDT
jgi:hypothetical protein